MAALGSLEDALEHRFVRVRHPCTNAMDALWWQGPFVAASVCQCTRGKHLSILPLDAHRDHDHGPSLSLRFRACAPSTLQSPFLAFPFAFRALFPSQGLLSLACTSRSPPQAP